MGAFYFIVMLSEGNSIDNLFGIHCTDPIFMVNPLFLHFCLWLIHCSSYYPVQKAHVMYETMRSYVLNRIDFVQLNLSEARTLYPALDFSQAHEMKDLIIRSFLEDVLSHCQQTYHLIMDNFDSINWTLTSLRHLLPRFTSLGVRQYGFATSSPDRIPSHDCVKICLDGLFDVTRAAQEITKLVTTYTKKNISLTLMFKDTEYSWVETEVNLSQILHEK